MSDPTDERQDGDPIYFLEQMWADLTEDLDRDELVPPLTHDQPG
jgi:hypothetical protein